ncbi:hypothetical protein NEOLEDRAFT_1243762 [Neolentinus lepideus HHB14362 ss-1]|uniref:Uncharacterized protein n=1 Tax=Neolentinus lepideus HHB14362 ss-1 TaxID=1314782 RepID=A0A165QNL5_9AGAM|nr:hypothetical protein NEOLEDRAFT_1243762 [Neolentinus lepideus HHB14362 ss-1]
MVFTNNAHEQEWRLTVVRTHNVHQLKQEKSWRPIVQLAVDQQPFPEVMLGVDGQNPNLKTTHIIHDASHESRVVFEICCQAKTKKKQKRRTVLARASMTLGEILVRQDAKKLTEIKLTCQTSAIRRLSSNGSGNSTPTRHPHLHVRLLPPPSITLLPRRSTTSTDVSDSEEEPLTPSSDRALSETLSVASEPVEQPSLAAETVLRHRKRKPKGYHLFSGSECGSEDSRLSSGSFQIDAEETVPFLEPESPVRETFVGEHGIRHWIAGSFLPQYSPDRFSVLSQHGSSMLDIISPYQRLNDADGFEELERVMRDLQAEWNYAGASLIALAAIDATVFGLTPDSTFAIDSLAKRSVAAGGLAAGLGLAIDVWLILQYNCADPRKFQTRALGVFDNYISFCITCRLPTLCLFVSTCALLLFLCSVAFAVWPTASVVVCFVAGFLVVSQYLVWAIMRGVRAIWRGMVGIFMGSVTLWRGMWDVGGREKEEGERVEQKT